MIAYTRRELLDAALDFVGENNDANARNTAERLLNMAMENVWSKMAWQLFDMPDPFVFSTVNGVKSYSLPPYFGRVRDGLVRNLTTGGRIFPLTLAQLQEKVPFAGTSLDAAGAPQFYAIGGTIGVDVQVTPNGELVTAVSDDPGDTANVKIEVLGFDGNGVYRRSQATLNGIVPVSLGLWTRILEVSKAYQSDIAPATEYTSSRGTVTVTGAQTGVLVTLRDYDSAIQRIQLTLWPTPDSVYSVSVPITRAVTKMLYDADMCPLGWGPVLLETMDFYWKLNSGDIRVLPPDSSRPALLDLIALENSNRFGVASRTRPFTG